MIWGWSGNLTLFDATDNNILNRIGKHMLKWTPALNYIELKARRSRPSLPLRTLGVHSTSISFRALLPHLQFLFHLSAAKCVYSNTWQAHWRCTGSLPTLRRVTGGQHTTPAGLLMFNSDCNPFSQPVIQLFSPGHSLQHPGQPEGAVVPSRDPLCPLPSTFASA